ncbi:hypothetical protein [Achromobacter phage Motura]|uniref:Uncharacterized protein n=1 Tax=Achromobacter phage Motura TaxID=2591403 RepID=A0A514CSK3_9CAUD|nr:hypothetical protein H1O15_gp050 [Achromobacter phage Motura]QDH83458.1 hypothetical protein [Achromobacter phage Motura]
MAKPIPEIGGLIALQSNLIEHMGANQTPVYRVRYNKDTDTWEAVVGSRGGFLLFLNSQPEPEHNFLRVSSIIKTGNGAWADPVTI